VTDTAGWVSLRIQPGANREAAIAALFEAGAQGVQEVGADIVTQMASDEADGAVQAVLAASPDARVSTMPLPVVDWAEEWKKGIRAHELGALVVTPPWLAAHYDPARAIVIEPAMAFGTGEHATTRGVIRLLERVLKPGDHVADLGAGSAVLSIAAAKLGAARVAAIEMDHDSIANAEENVRRNGVDDRVVVIEGDARMLLPLVAPVRVIMANILSHVIVELLPAIGDALEPNGQAILSGVLAEERDGLVQHLETHGWRVTEEDREEIWWSATIVRS
jgi:ribosomal protein L11 methyltransferase